MKRIARQTRRNFLKAGTAFLGFPTIVPASIFGQNAPSNRITMGVVGWGMMGPGNTKAFMNQPDCQVVAACDVDSRHLEAAVNTINDGYKNKDCQGYKDFRELLTRPDIDAVMLALPDHWHAYVAVFAAANKKDIYGEKPLARTIAEQQAIVAAVKKHDRIFQVGSQQRSDNRFRTAAEIVANGLIGKIREVHVGLPGGHTDFAKTGDKTAVTPPPPELDYEMWIGPSKMEDYIEARVHRNWRWNYNIGAGQLIDWIGHHCDIAHWGMQADHTGPMEINPIEVEFPPSDAVWNTATKYRSECKYADGTTLIIAGGYNDIKMGAKWIGSDGWVWVDRSGYDASRDDLRKAVKRRVKNSEGKETVVDGYEVPKLDDGLIKTRLYESPGHHRNFLDCVKSRQLTICPAETGHHSAIPGHLSLIAFQLNRSLKWDPEKELIINDPQATEMLTREYRGPWKLSV